MDWGNIIAETASGAAAGGSLGGGVGAIAGGFVGLLNGFVSGAHKEQAESIIKSYEKRQQQRTNEINNWLSENTGTNMAKKAWNTAKDLTGTLTSQQSQSKAYSAENAQRNTGIAKSQAALSGFNTIGNSYSDDYDSTIESQTASAYGQLQSEADAKVTDYNNQSAADKQASMAKAKAESEKTLFSDITDTVGSFFSSFFSDATLKTTDKENDSDVAIIQLLDILPKIEDKEDIQLALDFMEIWYEVQSK